MCLRKNGLLEPAFNFTNKYSYGDNFFRKMQEQVILFTKDGDSLS